MQKALFSQSGESNSPPLRDQSFIKASSLLWFAGTYLVNRRGLFLIPVTVIYAWFVSGCLVVMVIAFAMLSAILALPTERRAQRNGSQEQIP